MSTTSLAITLSLLFVGVVGVAVYIILQKLKEVRETQLVSQNDKILSQLNENMQGVQRMVDENMRGMRTSVDSTTKDINERLDKAATFIASLRHEMGSIKEIGRSISDFQAFLKSPKIRGNIGESILYDALSQIFSHEQYAKQYKFKNGQTVDAIIHTGDGMIPIDSKFPMESFHRYIKAESEQAGKLAHREFVTAVRKHIRDISTKYILPQEGTVDFAIMYVPAESVYFEVVEQHEELYAYASSQQVMVVSPNIFSYFLKTVLVGIERSKLNEQAKQIWDILKGVQKETEKFGEKLSVLNRHITNARGAMDVVSGEYTHLVSSVDQVKMLNSPDSHSTETTSIDNPISEA